uniref:Uncharacterized protein n=1 Tax=Chenopodium quinoa TaxID=63459 RepID=A0A803N7A9_CHEQI
MAAPPLLRGLPLLRLRLFLHNHHELTAVFIIPVRRRFCSAASSESTRSEEDVYSSANELLRVKEPPKLFDGIDELNYRKWKDKEDEILRDIEPVTFLAKDIIHSNRDTRSWDGRKLRESFSFADVREIGAMELPNVDRKDVFCLNFTKSDDFSTKSGYAFLLGKQVQNEKIPPDEDGPASDRVPIFLATLWEIWLARNEFTFSGNIVTAEEILGKIDKCMEEHETFASQDSNGLEVLHPPELDPIHPPGFNSQSTYMDGERLTSDDEKVVIERLLAYHPRSEDKIGCGLDSIMDNESASLPSLAQLLEVYNAQSSCADLLSTRTSVASSCLCLKSASITA